MDDKSLPQNGLTLADVSVTHALRDNKVVTLSGADLAALITGTLHIHVSGERPAYVDAYAIAYELVGIAESLDALTEASDFSIDRPLHYLADQLKYAANRVCALDHGTGRGLDQFRVAVKK